jgi:ferredoxin-NADP reductase
MLLTLPIRTLVSMTPRALVVRLDLRGAPFPYQAGQAVQVGRPGAADRRPYSLATAPWEAADRGELELLMGHDGAENGSVPHMGRLAPGDRLEVEGPAGSFALPERTDARRFLFVAGGTGIAPLRAMLHDAMRRFAGAHLGLVYSARTADDFAYGGELRALAAAGRMTLWQTVTRDPGENWDGAQGRIARAHLAAMVHDPATLCFLCGPHTLVREASSVLAELGVPPNHLHVEDWTG